MDDEAVARTIKENPHLFKIITPIHVDIFKVYLSSHPNWPFVDSVCRGLHEGFWPWARTPCPGYPLTNDKSKPPPSDEKHAEFLRAQRDIEVTKERFSPPFKHPLLPGMYCMPIYAVPKPHSSNLCLVTDQSYGKYSLNSMIPHSKVTGYPLDNLVHFGEMLMDLERREPSKQKVAWKSDVAEAYHILPMHPHWQIKQINLVDDEYYVDCCNAFGGSGAGGLYIFFNSLVAWIAQEIKRIHYLNNYVNDSSGCGMKDDYLILHKQIHGSPLPVIGITADVNNLSFALSDEAKEALLAELVWWCKPGRKEKL